MQRPVVGICDTPCLLDTDQLAILAQVLDTDCKRNTFVHLLLKP